MTTKPASSWWSFRLWQLFAVMTLLCCYLAWQVSVVRSRDGLLLELEYSLDVTTVAEWQNAGGGHTTPASIPLVSRWLGDEPIQTIGYYHHVSERDRRRLARMFPEAELAESDPPQEPCHPGCFPKGTLVQTPSGPRLIETIQAGDAITAFDLQGNAVDSRVQSVFITTNVLIQINTANGSLLTTKIQPLCLSDFRVIAAGKLQPGDVILRRDSGEMKPVKIIDISLTHRTEQVFNLVLGNPEIFIANGFLARSKPPRETTSGAHITKDRE